MKENIETKDVQRTEYLDKNGLDMLWTKVKENTHNQVEVERNRAVAKENSIADTKADKSALGEYIKIASNTETKVNGVIRTVYVLKSVYDEKIAALEARIAALEAKHTETA